MFSNFQFNPKCNREEEVEKDPCFARTNFPKQRFSSPHGNVLQHSSCPVLDEIRRLSTYAQESCRTGHGTVAIKKRLDTSVLITSIKDSRKRTQELFLFGLFDLKICLSKSSISPKNIKSNGLHWCSWKWCLLMFWTSWNFRVSKNQSKFFFLNCKQMMAEIR